MTGKGANKSTLNKTAHKRPAVFLDRDGVINRRVEGDYIKKWSEFHFLPGVAEGIRLIKSIGFAVVIVTNQQGIGRGLMTKEDLEEIHSRMLMVLDRDGAHVEAVYYCPHLADSGCKCRKPEPGLLLLAADELYLDLPRSYMVGDSPSDIEASRRAGCRPVLISSGGIITGNDCLVFADLISLAAALEKTGIKEPGHDC